MTCYLCPRGHLHLEGANFCAACGSGPVIPAPKEPQILGSGAKDFTPCSDCPDSICVMAKACLRQRTQT
jgi:hypothetical protein